jgi:hypothetical protein
MRTEGLRDRLVRQIDNLPEDRLREVLDFVAGICALEAPSGGLTSEPGIDPANDPYSSLSVARSAVRSRETSMRNCMEHRCETFYRYVGVADFAG